MRIGIVGNDGMQVAALCQYLADQDVRWVVGEIEDAQYPCYPDYGQAMLEEPVDIIIDCTGDVETRDAMVVPGNAALFLLSFRDAQEKEFLHKTALSATAAQLTKGIEKIGQKAQLLDHYARQLTDIGGKLDEASQEIAGDLERTGRLLDVITRIAKRSKIIGLNSAIEASRVGEQGRGFAVVAEEIKSLADDSSRSVQDIEKILEGIQRRSAGFTQRTGVVKEVVDMQRQALTEIFSLLQSLKELEDHIRKLAQEQ